MAKRWLEYKCPHCKLWVEAVIDKDGVHKCYECGTINTIVSSQPCTICEATVKRSNLIAGKKIICDECKRKYKIGSTLS